MSEVSEISEVSKQPVKDRVKAVLGTLKSNNDLWSYPLFGAGGVSGGAYAALNMHPEHPIGAGIIGGILGGFGGLMARAAPEMWRESNARESADSWSDPGPVETGTHGKYKDLVTAWKTGVPQGPHSDIYHKDREDGPNTYST